jgi:LmbE family N-acetylglucosaminyl deacetylase
MSSRVDALGRRRARLAAVFAHPDDDAYTIGGTLARYAGRIETTIVLCTSGGNGPIWEPVATRETLAEVREREHEASYEAIGLADARVDFLRYTDGHLSDVRFEELIGRIEVVLRECRPEVVVTFGPDGMTHHPDHILAGGAATEAFLRAREAPDAHPGAFGRLYHVALRRSATDRLYREIRARRLPFGDEATMFNPVGVADDRIAVDTEVNDVYERKIQAIRMHRSQIGELERFPQDLQALQLAHECFVRMWPDWKAGSPVAPSLFDELDL